MEYERLVVDKAAEIATITLSVPEKLNALSPQMADSLELALRDIARDDDIRVIIVTGAGRAFCSGADVSNMRARAAGQVEQSRSWFFRDVGWGFGDTFPRTAKPVIAAINGACVGGGFALALSCDFRIAADTARFGALQIARALVPDMGLTYYLPSMVGMSKAMELMFTGEMFDAAEAKRLGLVNKVVPLADLMNSAREVAAGIARHAPVAVELTKKMTYRYQLDKISRHIDMESAAQRVAWKTEDHIASVRAFLDKEPPPEFKGR